MSDNFPTDAAYGQKFHVAVTNTLIKKGWLVLDTHTNRKLGYDILIVSKKGRVIKVELKRQKGHNHLFELEYRNAPSDWRGKADQMWVWSDGNGSFEVYDAKVLEAHLLTLQLQAELRGDKDPRTGIRMSLCVELPFECKEAGWIKSITK